MKAPQIILLLLLVALLLQPGQFFASQTQEYKLLKNAKIYTMGEKGVIEKGMILIKGGKIEKIGTKIEFPSEALIVDLSGKTVIPGIVCASSSLFLYKRDLTFSGRESLDTDILEGIDYFDSSVPAVLKYGVTTAYVSPVSFQFIGGLGAVVKLVPGKNGSIKILKEKAGLKLRLERLQSKKTSNLLRLTQYHRIRDLFKRAQEYKKEWQDYEKKLKEYEEAQKEKPEKKKPPKKKPREPKKPRRNEGNEILLRAMTKEFPVRFEVHRPDAVLNALKLGEEFGLNVILEKCEGWPSVLPQLEEASVSLLSSPLLDYKKFLIPGGAKGYAATLLKTVEGSFYYSEDESTREKFIEEENWNKLILSKIPFVLIPPDHFPLSARYMRFYASLLLAKGLSPEEALKTITLTPAQILGVSGQVGNLTQGKDADLVVLDGEPLSSLSKTVSVFVDGSIVWERKK